MTDKKTTSEHHEPLDALDLRLAQEARLFRPPAELADRIAQSTVDLLPTPASLPFAAAAEGTEGSGWVMVAGRLAIAACLALVVLVGIWAFWPTAPAPQTHPSRIMVAAMVDSTAHATMLSPAVERLLVESDPTFGEQVVVMLDARDATWCGISGELQFLASGMQTSDIHRSNVDLY
jgi:hypothetical protein